MAALTKPPDAGVLGAFIAKLRNLGLDDAKELQPLLGLVKVKRGIIRGEDILSPYSSSKHLTVLLTGIACLYKRLEDGSRQICTFQYSGDFCDLHRHVLRNPDPGLAVGALSDCSVGTICYKDLDRALEQHPKLSLALWRSTMLEASIFRERLLHLSRRPALERVAHLLCEQLARRDAADISDAIIPLTQIDLADAAGLSVVHVNRTFQELRKLGVLSENGRAIEVVNRKELVDVAKFDPRYLDMPKLLFQWQVHIEGAVVD